MVDGMCLNDAFESVRDTGQPLGRAGMGMGKHQDRENANQEKTKHRRGAWNIPCVSLTWLRCSFLPQTALSTPAHSKHC